MTFKRYSTEVDGFHSSDVIDAEGTKLHDLTDLSSEECRVLLENLIGPKIVDLTAWLVTLNMLTGAYRSELETFKGIVAQASERHRQIKLAIEQIDRGILPRGEGIEADDVDRLTPLLTRPGRQPLLQMLAMRQREAGYLISYVSRWPNAEATNPYRYDRPIARIHNGVEIQPGHLTEMTEAQSRAFVNVFVPVSVPRVIVAYRAAIDAINTGPNAFEEAIEKLDAAITGKKAKAA